MLNTTLANLPLAEDELIAAIDIGSNSFHLAIARLDHGEVRKVVSLSEKVQLAAGLDENNILGAAAERRGLDCLSRFVARLDSVSPNRIRVVATNALRQAKNANDFITRANKILPKPIEVIAGREEARLIYLGVSHTNASSDKRLVIDIGGGSTEFIIGQGFDPLLTESLQMAAWHLLSCFLLTVKLLKKPLITPPRLLVKKYWRLMVNTKKQAGTVSSAQVVRLRRYVMRWWQKAGQTSKSVLPMMA